MAKTAKSGAQLGEKGSSGRFGHSVQGPCQQYGGAIDDEEFMDSVTGGIRGRLHDCCYRPWFSAHVRSDDNKFTSTVNARKPYPRIK